MSTVTHLDGSMEPFDESKLQSLLDELVGADGEHADVSVQHTDGVSLSVFASGRLVVEDVEEGLIGPIWSRGADRSQTLDVMNVVGTGDFTVRRSGLSWTDGYGPTV
ncbi:hypothetical protein ENKNEFLB_00445 [Nocardioides aquaticus]|jgi:hypothetical protein|uniref:Halobacterial output domain-containing protein n=1 Tax=Nocardioides aquaticus TaxID=160826 RepID=A0ABX8ECB2_9ACTN|nr:hypothetical protein [Nocardioides aquaticus]QVT78073.1 hypothetical protein ENKNEFLB_00445 [Nocardioides aquaticus]